VSPQEPVPCRKCPRKIRVTPAGVWLDDDGGTTCQKYTGQLPAELMLHEPMPELPQDAL
jgi:hypothetical protein